MIEIYKSTAFVILHGKISWISYDGNNNSDLTLETCGWDKVPFHFPVDLYLLHCISYYFDIKITVLLYLELAFEWFILLN